MGNRPLARDAEIDLVTWAAAAGVPLGESQRRRLEAYEHLVHQWGRRVNLVSRRDLPRLRAHHLADCLVAARHVPESARVVDLGSGAGLPGIVVAIARPQTQVTLVEARRKRASFLFETARLLELDNVEVAEARIEDLATRPRHAGRYDVATVRALARPELAIELAMPFLRGGGLALLMCSPGEALRIRRRAPSGVASYVLPDGTPRRLVAARNE